MKQKDIINTLYKSKNVVFVAIVIRDRKEKMYYFDCSEPLWDKIKYGLFDKCIDVTELYKYYTDGVFSKSDFSKVVVNASLLSMYEEGKRFVYNDVMNRLDEVVQFESLTQYL